MQKKTICKKVINTAISLAIYSAAFAFYFVLIEGVIEHKINKMLVSYNLVEYMETVTTGHESFLPGADFFKNKTRKVSDFISRFM